MRCHRKLAASLVVVVTWSLAFGACAQPLADRLPGDAVFYAGWAGSDSPGPGYEGSHLKAFLDSCQARQLFTDFLPKVLERIAKESPEAAPIIASVQTVYPIVLRHPVAEYVGPLDLSNPNMPMPRIAYLFDAKADAPALMAELNKLVQLGQQGPVKIAVQEREGLVVFSIGNMTPAFTAIALGGPADATAKRLTETKEFTDALAQVKRNDAAVAVYLNVEGLVALVDQAVAATKEPTATKVWPQVRDSLNLKGIQRLIATAGFEGKDWGASLFVAAPEPRTGLAAALAGPPLSRDIFTIIPKTATTVSAFRFNVSGLLDGIRTLASAIDPAGKDQVDQFLQGISQAMNMDLQKDLLDPLGDQWLLYTDSSTTGSGMGGLIIINKLKDPAKAEQSLTKLEQFINAVAAAQLRNAKVTIAFQQQRVGDLNVHYLAIPLVTPSWAIKDGNLIVGLYPQTVVAAAEQTGSKRPSILENEAFQALIQRIGGEGFSAVQFMDLPRSAPHSYTMWLAISHLTGIGDLFGVPAPLMVLPPLNKLLPELGPAGSVTWSDALGLHSRAITPFPGAELIASDGSTMLPAILALETSVMLPALARARESANRVKCASNLRMIGQGCLLYANEHNGKYPPDLGTLCKEEDLTPMVFICQTGGAAQPPHGLKADDAAAWVNAHSDYVYLGAGRKNDAPAEDVICYEKTTAHGGQGINLLFGDGHVEFQSLPGAQRTIERTKAKLGQ